MDLNLRDVPAEIMRSLRVDAAAEGVTIKELCLRRLVPDGGESWKPQTITGKPIAEKKKEVGKSSSVEVVLVGEAKPLAALGEHVTDVTKVTHVTGVTESMCSYTEYDPETGETYRCGRTHHGLKVKHTRGEKL
jgi:hypothetical protein